MHLGTHLLPLLAVLLGQQQVLAHRILLIPTPFKGHLNYFVPLGQALIEGGHETYIVLSTGSKGVDAIRDQGLKVLQYHPEDGICQLVLDAFHKNVSDAMLVSPHPQVLASIVAPAVSKECENFLLDPSIYQEASNLNFDLAIVDGLFFARCLYLFPVKLGIPYATLTTFQEFWQVRAPAMPSHVPFHYAGFSEKMTFAERFQNTLINIIWALTSSKTSVLPMRIQEQYADLLTANNFDELILKSELWFFNSNIALDYPKPSMPNIIQIGGMSPHEAKPLEEGLQQWMDKSENGVIIASFGSIIVDVPHELNIKMLEAFRNLPWNVLWRNKNTTNLDLPHNVKAMPWLPQNDVLGHKNTLAFITHCGNNGQFEALYHQVPMIGLPIFADQPYNARRMEYKGYGIALDLHAFTPQQLIQTIHKVIKDKSFKENLKRGSRILKKQKESAKERAVFWVEHIIENGADHLRSYALEMPWYQFLLLDVFFVMFLILSFVVASAVISLRWMFGYAIRTLNASNKVKKS